MSSRIAKREHGLKLQLIRMHAQYMNLKVNQVHFCFILQANPKTRGYLWFCTECDESVSVENFGLHKEEYFVRYLLGVGGGGTFLYLPYRYVPLQRVGVLRRFGLKTGKDFACSGLNSGMFFEGMHERICRLNSK